MTAALRVGIPSETSSLAGFGLTKGVWSTSGGEGGIRTPSEVGPAAGFKTGAVRDEEVTRRRP